MNHVLPVDDEPTRCATCGHSALWVRFPGGYACPNPECTRVCGCGLDVADEGHEHCPTCEAILAEERAA